ncbi:MAG: cell division protein ZapA [Bacteroidaceae bacterium]|nr:cell division protein ZapA [Bacteroidaceae bacterium]
MKTKQTEDRELGINLVIDGISFPLTIKASEEPYYRQAARLTNEKLIIYKQLFSGEGGVRVHAMAALDIALELVKQADNVGSANIMSKVNELSRLIDNTIAQE